MIALLAGLVVAAIAAAVMVIRTRVLVVMVRGMSMAPTLQPGDRLFVRRGAPPTVGAIVVVDEPQPCRPGQAPTVHWVVKRVAAVAGDPVPSCIRVQATRVPDGQLVVLGDNLDHSRDSRHFGFAGTDRVIGVALRQLSIPKPRPQSVLGRE
jgi:signal peptidase I